MDSDERGTGDREEESEEEREQLGVITTHEESDDREELKGLGGGGVWGDSVGGEGAPSTAGLEKKICVLVLRNMYC